MSLEQLTVECPTIAETQRLGQVIGRLLFPGAVLALVGPLGAGKTLLTRAIAEGLDISDPNVVISPTFVLIQEYEARLPIYHFDVYRLKKGSDFVDLGVAEYFAGTGVSIIEWADKVETLFPNEYLRVELQIAGEQKRNVVLLAKGECHQQLLEELTENWHW